jgi:hypothetical protein
MDKLKFDLTTQNGLISTQDELKHLKSHAKFAKAFDINIDEMFKELINMISKFVDRFFDLFDDTKKLEKQMN